MPVEISLEAVAELHFAFGRCGPELVDQRGESGVAGLDGEIPPQHSPIFSATEFVEGRQYEEKVAGHTEILKRQHRFRQKFSQQHLLIRRVHFQAGDPVLQLAGSFHSAAVLGEPDRQPFDAEAFHVIADGCHELRVIADGAIGVDIENVEIFACAAPHDRIGVGEGVRPGVTTDRDRNLGGGRLETQIGGFQRGGVVPSPLGCESGAVLLVPEFPGGHPPLESFRRFFCKAVGCEQIGGEHRFFIPFCPSGRIVVHAENFDATLGKQLGIQHILFPVEYAGGGLCFFPVHTLAHDPQPGASGQLRNGFIGVGYQPGIVREWAGQPALG